MKALLGTCLLTLTASLVAQDSETAVGERIRAKLKDDAADFWIYDDLERGYAEAAGSGKPLLVSFRCVP